MFLYLTRQLNEIPGYQNGNWHGLCVTWENEDGVFMVYFDGRLLESGNGFKSGNSLSSKGIFTLGIGSTDERIYSGRLGHVNAWPFVLEHPQLAVFSSKCGVERGEFVSWPQFRQGAVGINVIEGETCPFDGKNELIRKRLDRIGMGIKHILLRCYLYFVQRNV